MLRNPRRKQGLRTIVSDVRECFSLAPMFTILIIALAVIALLFPAFSFPSEPELFHWQRADLFLALEKQFTEARNKTGELVEQEFMAFENQGLHVLTAIAGSVNETPFKDLAQLEEIQFRLAALAAAQPRLLARAQAFINKVRLEILLTARQWPVNQLEVHEAIYRVIYGGRSAIEEALVQNRSLDFPALATLDSVPSATPYALVEGVQVHSGDIIVSRGGAPTSALIARGNLFPGLFSHVALVHVDEQTKNLTIIESLIEKGAVLTTAEDYLNYKSRRLLLLRLRPNHPALQNDPLIPHKAASAILDIIRESHVPYDFALNWSDRSKMFCAEVPYHAYQSVGMDLWSYKSRLTSRGIRSWLGDLGAKEFITIIPSDLEYDPNLIPVAEWRDLSALRTDRVDNTMLDALLEAAERGDRLGYAWYEYPVGALVKFWSWCKSLFGFEPTIPEGMSISAALRVNTLVKKLHPLLKEDIEQAAEHFEAEHGYVAPYWALMDMAREILIKRRDELPLKFKGPEEKAYLGSMR